MLAAAAPMKRLDRYVGKTVLGAFLAAVAFFSLLVILTDMLGNMPRYVRNAERNDLTTMQLAALLLDYYVVMLPAFLISIVPFVTVIACMFALARLQNANEVVPMLFVGRPEIGDETVQLVSDARSAAALTKTPASARSSVRRCRTTMSSMRSRTLSIPMSPCVPAVRASSTLIAALAKTPLRRTSMPLIRDRAIVADDWRHVDDTESLPAVDGVIVLTSRRRPLT